MITDPSSAPAIDTSTTAGKIMVMQAYERGAAIEEFYRGDELQQYPWRTIHKELETIDYPNGLWNWDKFEYRIASIKTPLQRARDAVSRMSVVDSQSDSGRLSVLVSEIDAAPVVEIKEGVGFYTHIPVGLVVGARYRLLRDDP